VLLAATSIVLASLPLIGLTPLIAILVRTAISAGARMVTNRRPGRAGIHLAQVIQIDSSVATHPGRPSTPPGSSVRRSPPRWCNSF